MLLQASLLVTRVKRVDGLPRPAPPTRGRGRPPVYPDRLFLKAFVIMMVWRLRKVNEFLAVLAEPTPEMHGLRALLTDSQGRMPSRRTWERRGNPSHLARPDWVSGAPPGGPAPALDRLRPCRRH